MRLLRKEMSDMVRNMREVDQKGSSCGLFQNVSWNSSGDPDMKHKILMKTTNPQAKYKFLSVILWLR
jgi:hypothetical protein